MIEVFLGIALEFDSTFSRVRLIHFTPNHLLTTTRNHLTCKANLNSSKPHKARASKIRNFTTIVEDRRLVYVMGYSLLPAVWFMCQRVDHII